MHDKLLGLLVEQVKDYGLFVLSPDGHILTWNAGAKAIKGYEAGEIIGKHFSVFYTPDALQRGWPAHELRIATMEGRFEDEGWRVRKDGSRFWANVVITALRDENGGLLGFSKITRDLTQRRAAEEALRDSEERFRLLVEGVIDYAIFMLDAEGKITSWNSGAERILGYKPEEIVGKHFSSFFEAKDIDAGNPWEEIATARRTGRAEQEGWRIRKSGERFWARAVVNALHDQGGRLRGYAKVVQDLSQRQQARELEKTAERLNEFIAVLAHELRNPLAPIRTAVEVMDSAQAGESVHVEMRSTIRRQLGTLTRLLDEMLDISRVTRGMMTLEPRSMNLADVVSKAVETVSGMMKTAGHRLTIDVEAELPVMGDYDRLTQVIVNLLTNAAKFTASGGEIELTGRASDGKALISVRDSGCGLAKEDIGRVFDMFVQAAEPINRVGGGLGVGLALSRRIVDLHRGTLEARSDGPGKGSEFVMCIPLEVQAISVVSQPTHVSLAQDAVQPRRVLIVDDNKDAANTLGVLLRRLGHEVDIVYDGMSALKSAEEFAPDVVLLDLGMPGMNGLEVARRLRARIHRPIKIIAITGWGKEEDRRRSREAGFDVHLVKPIDLAAVRRYLEANGNGGTVEYFRAAG